VLSKFVRVIIVNEKLEHKNLTLQDYYQGIQKSRLSKISKVLNVYLVISILNFIPIYFSKSKIVCGNSMVAPFEIFFNICFPVGFLACLWGTKLGYNLKEWTRLLINLGKFVFPFPLVIQHYWVLEGMNMEIPFYSIWWLSFLKY
jgi:hypothetical protein